MSLILSKSAIGQHILQFEKPESPFQISLGDFSSRLHEAMLPTLKGVSDAENSEWVYRISQLGGWGKDTYTLYYDKNSEPFLMTHVTNCVQDGHNLMASQRFEIDTPEKKNIVQRFKWQPYVEVADQAKAEKLELVSGDDIPFVLAERINRKGEYIGFFYSLTIYSHLERKIELLNQAVKELKAIKLINH